MQSIQRRTTGGTGFFLLPALVFLSFGLAGCGNTVGGAQKDASVDTQKVGAAADQAAAGTAAAAHKAGQAIKDVPQDVDSAAAVTPEVKTAIVRDPVLNDPRNLINVNSHDHVTHLTGHVMSANMKARAAEDAQAVLTKRHPNYQIHNELTVSGGA
jgi:predicted small secreted protein